MLNAIEIKGLMKEYPGFRLDGLNLTLPSGSIMGLVGENGAGACPGVDHDTDSRYCAQAGSAVMAFPHKNDPCRAKPAGVLFCGGFFLFCNAAGRFRRKGAQPPPESHRYMILPAATQSFPSFLQT